MSDVGIITNTVTWFELQPERTKRRVKRDDLDTLTEIYVGPSAYEDLFVPVVGTMHADYTLMRVITTSVKRLPAAMTEITVNYQGKLANGGNYTSVPTINKYWMEGEVSYQVNGSAGQSMQITFAGETKWTTFAEKGIATYTRRYTGRCVELSYITNKVPTGEPTNVGLAQGFMGFQNIWDIMSGFSAGNQISGGGGVISKITCTDVRVQDQADGWYKVTETYQSRMFPGPSGYQFAVGGITGTAQNRLISSSTTQGNSNPDGQAPTPDQLAFWEQGSGGIGVAAYAAQQSGTTLATSAPGTVDYANYTRTGLQQAYGSTPTSDPTAAAQIYPTVADDSGTPYTPDVGATSQVYSG